MNTPTDKKLSPLNKFTAFAVDRNFMCDPVDNGTQPMLTSGTVSVKSHAAKTIKLEMIPEKTHDLGNTKEPETRVNEFAAIQNSESTAFQDSPTINYGKTQLNPQQANIIPRNQHKQ